MKSRTERAVLVAILLLGGFLRLGWPGLTEFKRDEAHLYSLALDLAEFKAFPLRGISSSVGLPNSPLSVYLLALPLFISKSPIAATLFVGALNTASVALAYAMARRYWGVRAAAISALLYAAAPWAAIYSRKIWAQDLLPLFTVACMFTAMLALVENRRSWLIAHLVLLAVAVQVHFSAIALALVTALLLIVFRRRLDWLAFLYGAAGAAITTVPIAVYVATRGIDIAAIRALLARPAQITGDALSLAAMVVQGTHVRGLAGLSAFRAFDATIPDFNPILWLEGVLVVLGAGYAVWRWATSPPAPPRNGEGSLPPPARSRTVRTGEGSIAPPSLSGKGAGGLGREAGLIVVLWLALPVLFFIRHSTPVFSHYFIILFPAPYLLAGVLLDAVLARRRSQWVWLLPVIIAGSQVWLSLALLRFVGTQNTPGAFGTPLLMLLQTAETAKRLATSDILVVSEGADPNVDLTPAVFEALLRGAPHRFVDGRTTAVFPAGEAAVILWPGDYPNVELYRQWGGGEWASTVPLRVGEGEVRLASSAGRQPAVPRPREASALLSNGAELIGSGGNAGAWELWWRAPGPVEGEPYHVFAHLLDATGTRVAQVDAPTYAPHDWRANDLVVSYFTLPGEGATVRAGMYAYPSLAPAHVLDVNGDPVGEWIDYPLVRP